jgi:hypothetical protein
VVARPKYSEDGVNHILIGVRQLCDDDRFLRSSNNFAGMSPYTVESEDISGRSEVSWHYNFRRWPSFHLSSIG